MLQSTFISAYELFMDRNVQMSIPFKTAVSNGKVKLTVLWDVKRMVHLGFMPNDTTMICG
jgi:hypothetical protein